jgi:hypothetical protein
VVAPKSTDISEVEIKAARTMDWTEATSHTPLSLLVEGSGLDQQREGEREGRECQPRVLDGFNGNIRRKGGRQTMGAGYAHARTHAHRQPRLGRDESLQVERLHICSIPCWLIGGTRKNAKAKGKKGVEGRGGNVGREKGWE